MIERELKLALPGRFVMPPITLEGSPIELESLPDLTLRATYFDTADLRLARHGVSLRYRTGETRGPIWTLKLPLSVAGSTVERNELHFDGPPKRPPPEARALVTVFARRAPLVAVATLRTRRQQLRVLRDATPLAELVDDEVSVVEGRRVVARFHELEIEALDHDFDLESLAVQLRAAGAADAEPIPKVVRALGSRATAPADIREAVLPGQPTMADALAAALADALLRLVGNEPNARLGDAEGIHQVRVALRRLRSDLRTLDEAVDSGWRSRIEPRLRDLASALGAVRDMDVLSESLDKDTAGPSRDLLAPVFADLDARRAKARSQLEAALNDSGYPAMLDTLVDALAETPVGPRAGEPAADRLPALVMAAWRVLEHRGDALQRGDVDAAFHGARIAAKRTRYAAELAARVLSGKAAGGAQGLAEQAAKVQDALGRVQDAVFAEATLRETLGGKRMTPPSAFEAGLLVGLARGRAADARATFFDAWPGVKRRRWRRWAL